MKKEILTGLLNRDGKYAVIIYNNFSEASLLGLFKKLDFAKTYKQRFLKINPNFTADIFDYHTIIVPELKIIQ